MKDNSWWKYALGVVLLHAAGIVLLGLTAPHHPVVVGLAVLAYAFGLRHAFDVDHIAFIDNTVRKFLEQRKIPTGVGFFFSLGHSSVVVIMVIGTVLAMRFMEHHLLNFQHVGSILGTLISGVVLILLAAVNFAIWLKLYQALLQMRKRKANVEGIEQLLASRGFFARLIGRLMRLITSSWHAYPVGFLFGLGFDTASEVALLAVSATAAKNALPLMGVFSLPICFAAGMSLMDTADGIFMAKAYSWAFSTPLRKMYYNLSVTGLGVAAAGVIGGIELMQVLTQESGLRSGFFRWIEGLNFGVMGGILAAMFVVVWAASFGWWKVGVRPAETRGDVYAGSE